MDSEDVVLIGGIILAFVAFILFLTLLFSVVGWAITTAVGLFVAGEIVGYWNHFGIGVATTIVIGIIIVIIKTIKGEED